MNFAVKELKPWRQLFESGTGSETSIFSTREIITCSSVCISSLESCIPTHVYAVAPT